MPFQILNTKVIFNALRHGKNGEGDNEITQFLTFDQVDINVGYGFDGSTGVFKVPISGIYKMSFSGANAYGQNYEYIMVYKNGQFYHGRLLYQTDQRNQNIISYNWMMRLRKGDEVQLYENYKQYASDNTPLIFTGELIHNET